MENQAANDDFLTEEKMEEIRNEIESKDIQDIKRSLFPSTFFPSVGMSAGDT